MAAITVSVDYDAIRANVATLRERAGGAQLLAVVKADAYGHGLVETARAARYGGAEWLGVAQPREALALRAAGDTGRILTWLYGPEVAADALIEAGVDLSVSSIAVLEAVLAAAARAGAAARLHLCVDTGLGREGVTADDLDQLATAVKAAVAAGRAEAVSIWSHFAIADAPGHPTVQAQVGRFEAAVERCSELGLEFELRHLANSAATLTRPDVAYDLVRPGIAVYGLPPVPDPDGANFGLVPAMRVTTSLALVKQVHAGQGVSYGHEYVTDRDTTLGLVSVGYADGVFRSAGGRVEVSIRGKRYRIAGRVCMDQFVVDLGPDSPCEAGDEVVLIGPDGPSVRDWAEAAGTIDYEIVCRFGGLRPKASS